MVDATPSSVACAPGALAAARPLRVAQVVLSLGTGGAEVQLARLVERLDPSRFEVAVFALETGGWLHRRLEERGVPIHCLELREGFRPEAIARLGGMLREFGADIVHCHNCKAFIYGGLASLRVPRARLILTKQGVVHFLGAAQTVLGRVLMPRTRAVVAVSSDIGERLKAGGWARADRLHVIPNSVDTDEFHPVADNGPARGALGLAAGQPVVGTVARLSPEKDQATLLRAFARVSRAMPDARLLIVGDGPLREELEALARELRIAEATSFLGDRKDVAHLLTAMDVLCLPSLTEGTSLTLLEAMASGLPVVASAVGGTPEVVTDGVSGVLVPPAEPDRVAEGLLTVLRDPRRAREMGTAGRRTVVERFSLNGMTARHAALYEQLCPRARSGSGDGGSPDNGAGVERGRR